MDSDTKAEVLGRIAIAVKQLRAERNLSQRELAQIVGCEGGTISQWENAKNFPKTEHLFAIADLRGQTWEEFVRYLRTGEVQTAISFVLGDSLKGFSKEELGELMQVALRLLLQ
jgi:transcriptional regulator with XRE-family HTH domain